MVLLHALLRLQRRAEPPYAVHAVHVDYRCLCPPPLPTPPRAHTPHPVHPVHAVHVDRSNRPESKAEATYLRRWCDARGVTLEVRRDPRAVALPACAHLLPGVVAFLLRVAPNQPSLNTLSWSLSGARSARLIAVYPPHPPLSS